MKQIKRIISLSIFSLAMSVSCVSMAQTTDITTPTTNYNVPPPRTPCSPVAQQAIANGSSEQLALAHRMLDPFNSKLLLDSKDANGASASSLMQQCVGQFWPGGGFRLPTLQDLINAAKQYIAQQCGELRSKIQQSVPSMQSTSFPTGIPGLPSVGYSSGVSNSGTGPVWTVNGQNPTTGLGGVTNVPASTSNLINSTINNTQTPSSSSTPSTNQSTDSSLIDKAKGLFGG